jgi:protein-S-isoprenylcysteine O-methyltransferase Ste14
VNVRCALVAFAQVAWGRLGMWDLAMPLASSAIILVGTAFTLFSLAALGRCFGIFPDARGLVTNGPYRLVRCLVDLGELGAILGMAVGTLSPLMLALFVATVELRYWRTIKEEQALTSVFPEYEEYRRRTPRLLPRLCGSGASTTRRS